MERPANTVARTYKRLPLQNGGYAIVDAEDYQQLQQYAWNHHRGRVYRRERVAPRKYRWVYLHREIAEFPQGAVDHVNHDTLDNRRANLRPATGHQNKANSLRYANNTSGFKGVSWFKSKEKWSAQIRVKGTRIWLGLFNDRNRAAIAYDLAAVRFFREFAHTNFNSVGEMKEAA